jgi:hypothetical protein
MRYEGPTPSIFERKDKFSFLNDPAFKFQSSMAPPAPSSAIPQRSAPAQSGMNYNDDVYRAAAQGAGAGGVSGALISGGLTAALKPGGMSGAGPWAAGGGLILSQIEAAKAAKARQEQERVENEKSRRGNMMNLYNNMSSTNFRI